VKEGKTNGHHDLVRNGYVYFCEYC